MGTPLGRSVQAPEELAQLLQEGHVPQRAFGWPRPRWRRWLQGVDGSDDFLTRLPDALDRRTTAAVVQNHLTDGQVASAFVAAMIWGHGYAGYGPYRTACVLTGRSAPRGAPADAAVLDKLYASAEWVRDPGPVEAYRYLNNEGKVSGLGPAFFTKWLYFTSASDPYGPQAAPVLDQLVTTWLDHHADVRLRYARTDDYARYLALLHSWGEPHGRTAVQVEEAIFRLIRDDGAVRSEAAE